MSTVLLRDYQTKGIFYKFESQSGNIWRVNSALEEELGFGAYQLTHFFPRKKLFVTCYLTEDSLWITIGQKVHRFSNVSEIRVVLLERAMFGLNRKMTLFRQGDIIDELTYVSVTNSSEEWPDDNVDICKFISLLPFENAEEMRRQLIFRTGTERGPEVAACKSP